MCQESTGLSPNGLVFGQKVKGPLAVLLDRWVSDESPVNFINYVSGFSALFTLYTAGQLEKLNLEKSY